MSQQWGVRPPVQCFRRAIGGSGTIRDLKVGKAPGPNGIPYGALKHLPVRAVSFLVQIFNTVLRTHHFSPIWKHIRVIYILNTGKDSAQPSSYRQISLLDTIGKLFERILLTTILYEEGECGLLRDEQFEFRPIHGNPGSWPASLKE
jgi:hypothetical protein